MLSACAQALGQAQRLGCVQGEWGRERGERRVRWAGASAPRAPSRLASAARGVAAPAVDMDLGWVRAFLMVSCAHGLVV